VTEGPNGMMSAWCPGDAPGDAHGAGRLVGGV